jgi:K+/H+ antiporter YhaU regulatory subunit KhtT
VIAIRDTLTDRVEMVPSADFVFKDSDVLVVIGKEADIDRMK